MNFNFTKEVDIQRAKTRLDHLINKKSTSVELTEKRTNKQNSYLHLILGWFAIEHRDTMRYIKENYFKKLCNPDIFVIERTDKYLGKTFELKSSSDITTEEMRIAIDRFRNWSASEAGIYLPEANEDQFLKHIDEEMKRQAQWL